MDKKIKKYFDLAYGRLGHWLTPTYEQLMQRYAIFPEECTLDEIDGYTYLLFCYPLVVKENIELLEQGILLVYENENIIADLAFMHGSMDDVMHDEEVYDEISSESDWSYLQHYTMCTLAFPNIPYPCCKNNITTTFDGEACFFTNIYVTKRYRKQHIFTNMLDITKEMVLRNCVDITILYSAISLDPDIASYGEDTPKEAYVYSMKDEPIRMINKQILENKGYFVVKLDEIEPNEESDGTKLWFAICKENEMIIQSEIA